MKMSQEVAECITAKVREVIGLDEPFLLVLPDLTSNFKLTGVHLLGNKVSEENVSILLKMSLEGLPDSTSLS